MPANSEMNFKFDKIKRIVCKSCPCRFSPFGASPKEIPYDNFTQSDADAVISILQNNYSNIDASANAVATLIGKASLYEIEYTALRSKLDESLKRLLKYENNNPNIDAKETK
jgi:hypothetical protein